jgi:hypothetical protein
MRALWRAIVRIVFWSYERGSWPYDLMVIAIVIFVLATPRHWFHDQPQATAQASAEVQVRSEDALAGTRTYRIDANMLPAQKRSPKPTPELERETHDILARTVDDLKGHTFQVREIHAVRGADGAVTYYDITIHP